MIPLIRIDCSLPLKRHRSQKILRAHVTNHPANLFRKALLGKRKDNPLVFLLLVYVRLMKHCSGGNVVLPYQWLENLN